MPSHLLFIGTYTRTTSRGIYSLQLDTETGTLSAPTLAAETSNPTWIELSPDRRRLYAVHESSGQATGFAVDPAQARLTPLKPTDSPAKELNVPANPPSHLAIDATGRALIAANYRDGFVAALPIRADGTLGSPEIIRHAGCGPHPTRQEKPHPHSVTISPDNRFALICDLGVDRIYSYALDPATARLSPANPPFTATAPGAGPRHSKFSPDSRHAYVINELANTLTAYRYEPADGSLSEIQSISTLPSGFKGESTAAEVRIHPNGRFVYGSNRGYDSIAVFRIDSESGRLNPVEIVPSGGKNPRNFALSPDGRWLVCAHQDSDNLCVFRVDPATGRLARTNHEATVPMGVCVLFR